MELSRTFPPHLACFRPVFVCQGCRKSTIDCGAWTTEMHSLSSEGRSLRPRCQQGWFLLRLWGRVCSILSCASGGLGAISGISWLVEATPIFVFTFMWCSPSVYLCPNFPFSWGHQSSWTTVTLMTSWKLSTSAVTLFPHRSHSNVLGVWNSIYEFEGAYNFK